jgi:hypothetical protein
VDSLSSEESSYEFDPNLDITLKNYENIPPNHFHSQMINFIHMANLNKSTTTLLLSLLRTTCSSTIDQIPKTIDALWKHLNIDFCYQKFYYCSSCYMELNHYQDSCQRCVSRFKANSELCIFSLAHEIKRVIESNLNIIEWYSLPEHHITSDIINGESHHGWIFSLI